MAAWPTFSGTSPEITWTEEYRTETGETDGGKKVKGTRWTTPIIHYHLRYNFLRAADFSTLKTAFESLKGQWGTATMTDPVAGGSVTVEAESDELEVQQIVPGICTAELDLCTVK